MSALDSAGVCLRKEARDEQIEGPGICAALGRFFTARGNAGGGELVRCAE